MMTSETELPRILCVDDEPNVLSAMVRNLASDFEVDVANSGEEGLQAIRFRGPFAVIMSDMRMPGMDGATFLAHAKAQAPQSVRVLLTGQADLASSIAAINEGAIFRYLCKPCPHEQLVATLNEAVGHYRLQQAEKELLETTVSAAVNTLAEVLAMVAPWAFQRATFVQNCVRHALKRLEWPDSWMYQLAAALSQIGYVGIPTEVVQADAAQRALDPEQRAMLDGHPEVAHRLVHNIPRLETVARIILFQKREAGPDEAVEVIRGSQLLRAALALERHATRDKGQELPAHVLAKLNPPIPEYIINALADLRATMSGKRAARVAELVPGWVVEEDVRTTNGLMVLTRGHELTATAIAALQRLLAVHAIMEPIRVSTRQDDA